MFRRAVLDTTHVLWALLSGCGAPPLSAEDEALLSLADAYAQGDCVTVVATAPGFTSNRSFRVEEATYYLGRCMLKLDRFAEGIELLSRVVDGPRKDDALYYLGRAYYQIAHYPEAGSAFDRLISEHPGSTYLDNAYYRRILVLLRTDDCGGAHATFIRMEQAVPESEYLSKAELALMDGGCP